MKRWALLAVVAVLFAVGYYFLRQHNLMDSLVDRELAIKQFYRDHPLVMMVICFLIYVVVTGLSIPGALLMSLVMAWFLGFWPALVTISLASTTGATLAFLMARFLFRDWYRDRFSGTLDKFNEELDRNGPFYLFTLRLTPAVPFFVINAVMGLTQIRTWTFWWISLVGMLPWTAIYVNAGSRIPDLVTLQEDGLSSVLSREKFISLAIALVLIGVFPLAVRWWLGRRKPSRSEMGEGEQAGGGSEKKAGSE